MRILTAAISFFTIGIIIWWNCLPAQLFHKPNSLILQDRNGAICSGRIASDGQWRFPADSIIPEKFEKCILTFEDKRFYQHAGVDLKALLRAVFQNFSSGKKISGASTISMQVIRLSREKERSIFQKFIETLMATRLEFSYSKKEILALYTSNAPFGGNAVGLSAASWRYYGKPAELLSWGESAALAVLPNSPSLVHPGRNRNILRQKRDRLLHKLKISGIIDSSTMELALLEPLPDRPLKLPDSTPHLAASLQSGKFSTLQAKLTKTTIDEKLQNRVAEIMAVYHRIQSANGVNNMAAIAIDAHTGEVLVYAGNVQTNNSGNEASVDNIPARRSTGSVLKPLLYACMLDDGLLLPSMLVPDIPLTINAYSPKNFNSTFEGAVPADKALARSLNIPAVFMLKQYTVPVFLHKLNKLGFTTFDRPAGNYGLSLILGGGETNLWELAGVYCRLVQTLNNFNHTGTYTKPLNDIHIIKNQKYGNKNAQALKPVLSASAIWQTFESMVKVSRPDEEKFWANFESSAKIAWKTGTSFGNRDAWAVGCTPDYVVAVWVGNSNGTGRSGLTGISAAAPVMFDIFRLLPSNSSWFSRPSEEMTTFSVCTETGFIATESCNETKEIWIRNRAYKNLNCPYHHSLHLDKSEKFRVHADCYPVAEMVEKSWFVLPPLQEKYFKLLHPSYQPLPEMKRECTAETGEGAISLISPRSSAVIYLPVGLQGIKSSAVFEAMHRNLSATIYWHIDNLYAGKTTGDHQLAVNLPAGKHRLVLADDDGNRLEREFEIAGALGIK